MRQDQARRYKGAGLACLFFVMIQVYLARRWVCGFSIFQRLQQHWRIDRGTRVLPLASGLIKQSAAQYTPASSVVYSAVNKVKHGHGKKYDSSKYLAYLGMFGNVGVHSLRVFSR